MTESGEEETRISSLSGFERNRLFVNDGGRGFHDLSAVSGMDTPADSRSLVLWDYDRDGWQDIALVNANAPLLNIYHNDMGGEVTRDRSVAGGIIALRFVGGNRQARASQSFAARDGYGAKVTVACTGMTLHREHRCGEGFAAQNSATMIVGIGDHRQAQVVTVHWPSGKAQTVPDVAAGTLLTAFENPEESPDGTGFSTESYRAPVAARAAVAEIGSSAKSLMLLLADGSSTGTLAPRLRAYTTMATWCAACKRHLPQLDYLSSAFPSDQLQIFGLPVDETDDSTKLNDYVATHRPAYKLVPIGEAEREQIRRVLDATTGSEALPSTVVTDATGRVLEVYPGVPLASQIAGLLDH